MIAAVAWVLAAQAAAAPAGRTAPAGPPDTVTVVGRVTLRTPKAAGATETIVETDRSGVVVYLTGFRQDPPASRAVIRQKEKSFIPAVLPITAGQTVDFPNADAVFHNVFSVSKAREFDLGLTRAPEVKSVDFSRPGLVDVYCNIHPDMAAAVLVLPNRAFAVTSPDGSYRISGIPAGREGLRVWAWSRRCDPSNRELPRAAGRVVRYDWDLVQTKALPPHRDKHGRAYRPLKSY